MKNLTAIICATIITVLFGFSTAMAQPTATAGAWSTVSNVGSSTGIATTETNVGLDQVFEAGDPTKLFPTSPQATFVQPAYQNIGMQDEDAAFGESIGKNAMYLKFLEGDMLKVTDHKGVETTVEWAYPTAVDKLPPKIMLIFDENNGAIHGSKLVGELITEATKKSGVPPLRLIKDAVSTLRAAQKDGKYLGGANAIHITGEGAQEFARQLSLGFEPGISTSSFGGNVSFAFGGVTWNSSTKRWEKNIKAKAILVPEDTMKQILLSAKLHDKKRELEKARGIKQLENEIAQVQHDLDTWKPWTPEDEKSEDEK